MAKQRKRETDWEKKHQRNVSRYQRKIEALYEEAAKQAALLGGTVGVLAADTAFSFDSQPALRKRAEKLLSGLYSGVYAAIVDGIKAEWTLANNKNSELSRMVFGDNIGKLTKEQYARYFSTTGDACDAFIRRKVSGLNLSDRVWKYTNQFKGEIETVLDIGIHSGHSADALSQDLREFLKYPDKLFRRVRTGVDEDGNPIYRLSKAAEEFHPGQGVYRSSYKNARRLAATETNIAYRTSDYDRWQDMDFIVGIKICLSNNHTLNGKPFSDICDELKGNYPKDFKFTGWHPHCRCHVETIMKTREELDEDLDRMLRGEEPTQGSVNEVKEVPKAFDDWIEGNKERAKGWASMPYFAKDNPQYVKGFEVDTYTPAERKFTRARRTNEAMKESLGKYLQSKYPDIPNTEKAAIFHYTRGDTSAYRQLNNQLRKGNLSEFNEAFSELLSSGLAKIEPVEQTVYRTVRLNKTKLGNFVDLSLKGGEETFKGFTSASTDMDAVLNFAKSHAGKKNNETDVLLVITGKTGRPIEGLSQFGGRFDGKPNQHEVLFDKGMRVRFDKVEITKDGYVFYLTEI
jgi:hypothetical protein